MHEMRLIFTACLLALPAQAASFEERWGEILLMDYRIIGEGAGNSGARPTGVERAKNEIVGRTVPSPMIRRRVALHVDICARHHMRKTYVDRYRWRCRR